MVSSALSRRAHRALPRRTSLLPGGMRNGLRRQSLPEQLNKKLFKQTRCIQVDIGKYRWVLLAWVYLRYGLGPHPALLRQLMRHLLRHMSRTNVPTRLLRRPPGGLKLF